MKRAVLFVVLGPLLTVLVFALCMPLDALVRGQTYRIADVLVWDTWKTLPLSYLIVLGIAPLLGLVAWLLTRLRTPLVALSGAVIGFAVLTVTVEPPFFDKILMAQFILIGAIPAALCSWLAGRQA